VRVALGIDHCSSNCSRGSEDNGSRDNDTDGPCRQQRHDVEDTLLISVGKAVVSSAHVSISSGLVHSENSSVEVSTCVVELSAVKRVVSSVSGQFGLGEANIRILTQSSKVDSSLSILEHNLSGVRLDPSVSDGVTVIG